MFRSSFSNWQSGYCVRHDRSPEGLQEAPSPSPGSTRAGNEIVKGFVEAFEKSGGQVSQEVDAALPQRRIPGPADRDRRARSPMSSSPSSLAAVPSSSSRTTTLQA
jgi:hypothetical protein